VPSLSIGGRNAISQMVPHTIRLSKTWAVRDMHT
jgi:hypothetical protein